MNEWMTKNCCTLTQTVLCYSPPNRFFFKLALGNFFYKLGLFLLIGVIVEVYMNIPADFEVLGIRNTEDTGGGHMAHPRPEYVYKDTRPE